MPVGGELGIRAHEWWAYRRGTTHPLEKVLVIDPGRHYYDDIRVRLADDDSVHHEFEVKRAKLPCKWEDLDAYLEAHPEVPRGDQVATTVEPVQIVHTTNELRNIIHEEIQNALGVMKVSYTLREAAVAVGLSTTVLAAAVRRGDLVAHYYGTKPVFMPDDLRSWVCSLSTDLNRQ